MLGIPKLHGAVEHDNMDQVVLPVHRQADLRALTRKATRWLIKSGTQQTSMIGK